MSSDSELIRAMARYIVSTGSEATRCKNEIRKMLEAPAPTKFSGNAQEDAERVLTEIGAPTKLIGFGYCARAISIIIENPRARLRMMDLYKQIGEESHARADSVSRSIYGLVDTVFERASIESLITYLGNAVDYDTGKCSPGEFINRLAAYIRNHT